MWLSHQLFFATAFSSISAFPQLNFDRGSVNSEKNIPNIKYVTNPYISTNRPQLQIQPQRCRSQTERYDSINNKCLEVNHQHHCGANMLFVPIDEKNGECKCDVTRSSVPRLYNEQFNACYYINEKAYCKKGEWLQLGINNEGTCEPNPCLAEMTRKRKNGEKVIRTVFVQKQCLSLGTKCRNGVIGFDPRDLLVKCLNEKDMYRTENENDEFDEEVYIKAAFAAGRNKCSPGYVMTIYGTCIGDFNFEF